MAGVGVRRTASARCCSWSRMPAGASAAEIQGSPDSVRGRTLGVGVGGRLVEMDLGYGGILKTERH